MTTTTKLTLSRAAYSIATLAHELSISPDTIRAAMRSGELPAYSLNEKGTGKRMFRADDVAAWIDTWKKAA